MEAATAGGLLTMCPVASLRITISPLKLTVTVESSWKFPPEHSADTTGRSGYSSTYLKVLAGDATREKVEQLVLDLRNLIWPHQQLQHLLELVQEDNLLARASPWPVPNEALCVRRGCSQSGDGEEMSQNHILSSCAPAYGTKITCQEHASI